MPKDGLEDILAVIDPQWATEFTRFIKTGTASTEFLDVLDSNQSLQGAVERAIFMEDGNSARQSESSVSPERRRYDHVLRDVRLAAAALREAMDVSGPDGIDPVINMALESAWSASRFVIALLQDFPRPS